MASRLYPVVHTSVARIWLSVMAAILLVMGCPDVARAQTYTISPAPFETALDNAGKIINNACIWTYSAGTTNPVFTYQDNVGTPNSNPIRSDSAGRFTAYLLAGANYKFVYEGACVPPAHGVTLRTADNIAGVPAAAATVDVPATAGEGISAGQCAYLSDGSASKTAGLWYKCDSANTYSSTTPEVGFALNAFTSLSTGSIRLSGSVTGLSSLTIGAEYFVGTTGAITSTAPLNQRHLGHADTSTSLVASANPSVGTSAIDNRIDDFRLTLTTVTPVTTADVTAATTLFLSPYSGNRIALFSGTAWAMQTSAEISIAVPATTSQLYSVYVFNNAGVATLELAAWTNDTTPGPAAWVLQDGVRVKTGALTRRYVALMRTTTVSGQTEDSVAHRFVINYYNRVPRVLRRLETTASWAYSIATLRQANAAAANQLDILSDGETPISVMVQAGSSSTAADNSYVAIGEDSTTAASASCVFTKTTQSASGIVTNPTATLFTYPAIGRHVYTWLEWAAGGGTMTWLGVAANSAQTGISGVIPG